MHLRKNGFEAPSSATPPRLETNPPLVNAPVLPGPALPASVVVERPTDVLVAMQTPISPDLDSRRQAQVGARPQDSGTRSLPPNAAETASWKPGPIADAKEIVAALIRGHGTALNEAQLDLYLRQYQAGGRVNVEARSSMNIAGVFNAATGKAAWEQRSSMKVAGVFNPVSGNVEWQQRSSMNIAGAFNPITGKVEWEQRSTLNLAGVFNPISGKVEWQQRSSSNIAGAFNPNTKRVEWKEFSTMKVAGAFDPTLGSVRWETRSSMNLAMVYVPPATTAGIDGAEGY